MTRRTTLRPAATRRLARAVLTLLVAGAAVLGVATPAFAHDHVVSTSPADGSTVAALPDRVTVTFSDAVIAGGRTANEIQAYDASCVPLATGAVSIRDNVVTQRLHASPVTGPVHVLWRVVSQDGHAASGDFTFTVRTTGDGATASPAPCTAAATSAAVIPDAPTASALPWVVAGGALALVIAGVAVLLVARSRRSSDQ